MKRITILLLMSIVAVFFVSCTKQPQAVFLVGENYEMLFDTVEFKNNSTDYERCLWDFGDGTTSAEVDPHHVYTSYGEKNVTLTIYSKKDKESASFMKMVNIYHPTELKLNLTDYSNNKYENLTVKIFDNVWSYNNGVGEILTATSDADGSILISPLKTGVKYYFSPVGNYTFSTYSVPSTTFLILHETTSMEVKISEW